MKKITIIIFILLALSITYIGDKFLSPKPVPDCPILYDIKNDSLKKELRLFYETEYADFITKDSIVVLLITRKKPFIYYTIYYAEKVWSLIYNKNLFFAKMDDKIIAVLHGEREGYYASIKGDLCILKEYEWGVFKQIFPSQYLDYLENAEPVCYVYYNKPVWYLTFENGACIDKKRNLECY